jgi:ribose transport system permease protein
VAEQQRMQAPALGDQDRRSGAGRLGPAVRWALDNLVWFILAVLLVGFSLAIPGFFQTGIFLNIAYQATFVGILAIGLSFCIIAGQIDLSIESTLVFAAMLAAYLSGMSTSSAGIGMPGIASLAIVLAFGAFVGLLNAFLVVNLRIAAFIVTLAMYIAIRGLAQVLTGSRSIFELPPDMRWVANAAPLHIPMLVIILVAAYVFFHFVLTRTRFGRHVYLVGGNATAPFRAGIRVNRLYYQVFILSGVLAAVAGWLLAARTNGATPNLAFGILFEVFAAVVIGGVSLSGGVGWLSGVFAGALLLSSISTAINIIGLDPQYMQVIRGGLMLIAVLLDSLKRALHRFSQ